MDERDVTPTSVSGWSKEKVLVKRRNVFFRREGIKQQRSILFRQAWSLWTSHFDNLSPSWDEGGTHCQGIDAMVKMCHIKENSLIFHTTGLSNETLILLPLAFFYLLPLRHTPLLPTTTLTISAVVQRGV